jgi:hypothetical protein
MSVNVGLNKSNFILDHKVVPAHLIKAYYGLREIVVFILNINPTWR